MLVPVMVHVDVRHAEISTVVVPGVESIMVPVVWMVTFGVTAVVMVKISIVRPHALVKAAIFSLSAGPRTSIVTIVSILFIRLIA